jgi:hypothetical protein
MQRGPDEPVMAGETTIEDIVARWRAQLDRPPLSEQAAPTEQVTAAQAEATCAARAAVDAEMFQLLQDDGFTGPAWESFNDALG